MKITVEKEVFEALPNLKIGVIISKGIDNKTEQKKISKLLMEMEEMIKLDFQPENLAKHELISPWKTAYFEFGEKPEETHSSIEGMLKKIVSGETIKKINKTTDLINYLSLKHMIPMSSHDTKKTSINLKIAVATAREKFNSETAKKPKKGEIVLKDSLEVLSKNWGLETSLSSRITGDTKELVIFVFGLKPVTEAKLFSACKETCELLRSFCLGQNKYVILNKDNTTVDI